jgi:O-antigen/teichoic acid export membrane protein
MIIDVPRGWRTPLQMARDPGLLALAGAALLLCAPVLPGFSRIVVLPALLLAPGYALLRLLGQATGKRSVSVAVPVSLVLAVCASLVLDVSGIRLGPLSLGLLLGGVTALFLAVSYGRQLVAGPLRPHQGTPSGHRELAPTELWPAAGDGPKMVGHVADGEHDEADFVTEELDRVTDEGEATPGQLAVFYRTSAQPPAFQEIFIRAGRNGNILSGLSFYERREVRDLLAYLQLIANPEDDASLRRVLNVPRRGIGHRTEQCVANIARWDRTSFAAALARPGEVPGLSPQAVRAIEGFNELLSGLRADADAGVPVAEIAEAVLERSGYVAELEASSDLQDKSRIENLNELVAVARAFDTLRGQAGPPGRETEDPGPAPGSLADFLEQVSLAADADRIRGRPRQMSAGPPHGGPGPHDDVVPTAPGDRPAATDALRAMFTRDFVYLGVSALQVVLAAVITPILTRRVGVGEFGQLTLAIVVAQLLGLTFSLGLPFAAQKVFAGEDGDRRSRGVLAISTVFAVAASLVVVLAAPAWAPAVGLDQVLDARLAAVWAACFALTLTSLAMLRSRERLSMAIFVAALQSVGAQAVGVLLLYTWEPTVTSYLCGLIIGQSAAAVFGLLALTPDWSALAAIRRYGPTFRFGLPMVPQQLSAWILGVGDRVVVRHVLGSAAVGRYSVAYNVGSLGFILLVLVTQVWMPRIYAVDDPGERSRLLASSRDMMNLLLIPVVCGLAAGAPVVLAVWVPRSFHPAELTPIVAIVAICTFPFAQFTANLRALMSEGGTGRAAVATLIAAAVNIGLNIVMVPFLGITGSAIATVLSYALCARLTRPPVSSSLQVPRASVLLRALIGGAIVVTLAIGVLPASPVWLAIRLAIGAGALLAFAWLLRRAMAGFGTSGRLVTPVA